MRDDLVFLHVGLVEVHFDTACEKGIARAERAIEHRLKLSLDPFGLVGLSLALGRESAGEAFFVRAVATSTIQGTRPTHAR